MNKFLPMGQVTGIGSLPHTDIRQAVEFVAQHSPHIPFIPELPRLSPHEESIARVLGPVEDLITRHHAGHFEVQRDKLDVFLNRLDSAAAEILPTHSVGIAAMTQALKAGRFPDARAVKAQLVGLTTLAFSVRYEGRPFAHDAALIAALAAYLRRLAHWQMDWLAQWKLPTLLFFDEPCLAFENKVPSSKQVIEVFRQLLDEFRGEQGLVGVHTCALSALDSLLALNPEVISFDAYAELELFLALPQAKTFIREGGLVALGLVPTWDDLSQFSAREHFWRLLMTDLESELLSQLAQQSLVTATCGLAFVSPATISRTFEISHQVSDYLEQMANTV